MGCPETILIVDDERKVVETLQIYLRKEGYQVLYVYDDTTAMRLLKENEVSLTLLDLMLPGIMGEQVYRSTRTVSRVPIIMLTARTGEADPINGFQMGADDHIFKLFSPRAVVTKAGTVSRRAEGDRLTNLLVSYNQGRPVIDSDNIIVKVQGKETDLIPTELKILAIMVRAPSRIFTKEQLITHVLNDDSDGYDWGIDTCIKGIQLKVEDGRRYPSHILMVHGLGYKFTGEMK